MNAPSPRTVLVAPDSFKGTYTAGQVAAHIAAGATHAGWQPLVCPVADGGDGTLDAIAAAREMTVHRICVEDALGDETEARFLSDMTGLAFVEAAEAIGLAQIGHPNPGSALMASSRGVGQIINRAVAAGATRVLVAVGGTSTSDGGAGLLDALEPDARSGDVHIEVLCDSTTSYEDAARVFGPQKGADEGSIELLTKRLHQNASLLPRDPRGVPGTGCGGGISGALWGHGARLVSGADIVLDLLDIDRKFLMSDLVITGEGRLDAQTLTGKLIARLSARARRYHLPVAVIAGQIQLSDAQTSALDIAALRTAGTADTIARAAHDICQEANTWRLSP